MTSWAARYITHSFYNVQPHVCVGVCVSVYIHSHKYVCKRTASNKHLGSFDDSAKSTTGGKSISPDGSCKVLAMVQQL